MLPQVMYAWAGLPRRGLEACVSEHPDQQLFNHDPRVATVTLLLPEETCGGVHRGAGLLPRLEIGVESRHDRRCQW